MIQLPRQAREKSSSGIYHLMLRGINRQNIFEDDHDRSKFIEVICHYKTISKYQMFAYCLMDNHVHLLMKETTEPISNTIKRISSSYVNWYNKKYDRCGHLFQERFRSEVVESDQYFITVLRYIHQNPIKAGMIKELEKYFWSSYHEYIVNSVIVDTDFTLNLFSKNREEAVNLLQTYIKQKNDDQCLEYQGKDSISDKDLLAYIRELGFSHSSEVQKLNKEERNDIVRKLKKVQGTTVRQIARITGFSKSLIDRI